jgi:DNA-binding transcriptional MocR family regulator
MARVQVRDLRRRDYFTCDNVIIDKYARKLGPYALSVYMGLLRHADQQTQSCFPSLQTLADKLGMSKDSVIRAVEVLKKAKLISVRHRKSSAGDPATNLYFIREVVAHSDHLAADSDHGGRPQRLGVAAHSDANKTQVDNTHQQDSGNNAPALTHDDATATRQAILADVRPLINAFLGSRAMPSPADDLAARRALLRRQSEQLRSTHDTP